MRASQPRATFAACHPEPSEAQRNAVEGSRALHRRGIHSDPQDPSTSLRCARDGDACWRLPSNA